MTFSTCLRSAPGVQPQPQAAGMGTGTVTRTA